MKVLFATRLLAEFACIRTELIIAGMSLMDLIAEEKPRLAENVGCKKINTPGYTTTFRAEVYCSIW